MAGVQAVAGMRRIGTFGATASETSHQSVTCRMAVPVSRRGFYVQHLGSKPNLASCRNLVSARSDRLRPAAPRQGRLLCRAAGSQVNLGNMVMLLGTVRWSPVPSKQIICGMQNPFRQPREMDGVQKALAGLPSAVFYGAALLLVTAAGALGFTAGTRAPGAAHASKLRPAYKHRHAMTELSAHSANTCTTALHTASSLAALHRSCTA